MESLDFLYGTALGRALLRPLVSRPVSKLAGAFLDTPLSRPLIPIFVKNCGIDTGDYDLRQIRCFNDFFCRPLKAGRRPIDPEPGSLIAPCDGTVVSCTAAVGGYAMENACVVLLAEDAALYISVAAVSAADLSAASEVYATVNGQRVEVARRENGELYAARKDASAFEITDDGGHPVESGMAAVLFVISDRTENALIVPSSALHHDSGPFVYKVVDGVQVRQSVTVGVENDAEVQILSGLQEGDLVYAGT